MEVLGGFQWAICRVIDDWKKRNPKQNRETLPANYTTSTLRFVRELACRNTAPKTVECAKWTQIDPHPYDSSLPFLEAEGHVGPFHKTGEYVCDACKHPCVTNRDFITKLGLDIDERTLRRHLNDGDPMPVNRFRRVFSNAYALDWLGKWQAVSIHMHVEQMVVARRSVLALCKRILERKAFRLHQKIDIEREEIEKELGKQMNILDQEGTRRMEQALKEKDWSPEARQLFKDILDAKRRGEK